MIEEKSRNDTRSPSPPVQMPSARKRACSKKKQTDIRKEKFSNDNFVLPIVNKYMSKS